MKVNLGAKPPMLGFFEETDDAFIEGDVITLQEIFAFEQTGMNASGAITGHFSATGIRPRFLDRFQTLGIAVPSDIFDARKRYTI